MMMRVLNQKRGATSRQEKTDFEYFLTSLPYSLRIQLIIDQLQKSVKTWGMIVVDVWLYSNGNN